MIYNNDYKIGMQELSDNSIDLIVTDPPYLHVKGGMSSKQYNRGTWKKDSNMVTQLSDFNEEKIYEFLDLSLKKMKKANMYIFCSKLQLVYYFKYLSEHKKLKYDLLIWDKMKNTMKSSKFHTSDIEYIIRIYEPGVSLYKVLNKEGVKSDINYYLKKQSFPQPKGNHNTMKPIELIKRLIEVSSNIGDLVVDPFIGSGTTELACIDLKRECIGYEIDKSNYEYANKRVKKHLTLDK